MDKNFDPKSGEPQIRKLWESKNAFAAGVHVKGTDGNAPRFCIMMPPPNVTGVLHMGHAFNSTLQDILVRWHRMRGFDTLWQPGQDHAGIATQMVVERQLAAAQQPSRQELGREAFLEKVWQWKEESGDTIIEQLKRLGASCDWQRNRFTMDAGFQQVVLKVFVDWYEKGLIYRDKRLVNWDPHFQTAISDLEVENIETQGHMWHFKYPLAGGETYTYVERDEDGKVVLSETRDYISIATTRPETMLGDGAVAVHPSDERYAPIVGKMVHLPLCDRTIPIITDEYPDPDFGSGAVKITGAHDFNDYRVAKRNNIALYSLMDTAGVMRDDNAEDNLVPRRYRGMDRFAARKAVIADIDAQGLMIKVEEKLIQQPFGDRSKVVIEPMLTDQWFVDAEAISKAAIAAVESGATTILPESEKKVYFHWMKSIEPWCISRQLWWGHQVPVWYDADGNQYCAMDEAAARAQAGGRELTRDEDVLDTWFSSGLWAFGTLGWDEGTAESKDTMARFYGGKSLGDNAPENLHRVLITGFDIIFFWVARMMMMSLAVTGRVPFEAVYVHPLVRDSKGKKMSKSLGNVLDPIELIDKYGADAVRFTLCAMAAMGKDLRLSEERIMGYRNFATKLWNVARFADMNEAKPRADFDPSAVKLTLNKWIVSEVARFQKLFDDSLNAYRFNDCATALYEFIWRFFCDWYVEFSKPLLQGEDAAAAQETRNTLAWVLDRCLILSHPVMPFITEKLWNDIAPREGLLAHQAWGDYKKLFNNPSATDEMLWVIDLINDIRSLRVEVGVKAGDKIPLVNLGLDEEHQKMLDENAPMIMRLARIESITIESTQPKGASIIPVRGGKFCLPLADIIDTAAESARLAKAMDKITGELQGIESKLDNKSFIANAPEAVIEKSRARLEEGRAELASLKKAQERLAALS